MNRHRECIAMYISDNPELKCINNYLSVWGKLSGLHIINTTFLFATTPSQFQQYSFLMTHMSDKEWFMFTDDDDIWHKSRTSVYYSYINRNLTLVQGQKCMPRLSQNFNTFDQIDNVYLDSNGSVMDEYVTFVMKGSLLKEILLFNNYFSRPNTYDVCYPTFDLIFKIIVETYIDRYPLNCKIFIADHWLYYYRRHSQDICGKKHMIFIN